MTQDRAQKIAAAPVNRVFSFLDREGVLASVGPSAKAAVTGRPPSLGSFGVRSVGAGIAKRADDACGGVTNADIKTTQEEYRAPIARKKVAGSRLREALTFVEGHHGGRSALNMMHGPNRVGQITFKAPGVIGSTEIDEAYRGLGLGRKMYGEAARRAPGGRLSSDGQVSPEAQNVWQSMMRRPAQGVETAPHALSKPSTGTTEAGAKVPIARWDLKKFEGQAVPSEGLYVAQLPQAAVLPTKTSSETMDEEGWKQTLKDIPLVIFPPTFELGTFGVKDVTAAVTKNGGVTNADLKTTQEEYRAPIARKKTSHKIATVPAHKKAIRRAMEILRQGEHSFHGTSAGGLGAIVEENVVRPLSARHSALYSPPGAWESYWGTGRPASGWATEAAVAVPTDRILSGSAGPHSFPRVRWPHPVYAGGEDAAELEARRHGTALNWTITPQNVDLRPKDSVIASKSQLSDLRKHIMKGRLRQIPVEALRAAQKEIAEVGQRAAPAVHLDTRDILSYPEARTNTALRPLADQLSKDEAELARRKTSSDKMDEESWKQTLKDIPLVILATGLGYGVGKTISSHLGQTLAQNGMKPSWTKHIPAATALLSSLGSYAMGRSRNELERRRQEARERAGSPSDQVGEKLSHEFSLFVGGKLVGGS